MKEALERYEIEQSRPLMCYVTFDSKTWTTVEINDRFDGSWEWGKGPYYDWCDANCSDKYNIVKYGRRTIYGRFRSAKDAIMFKLKWS